MTSKVDIHRLQTGVPGLDAILGGGLPEFSFNLIAGQPGSGKTTLAHQIMFALASPSRPALYLTVLGEPPLKMLRYQQQFSFFDIGAVGQSVEFLSLADDALAGDLDRVLARIEEAVVAHRPGLVFVDSFRSVVLASVTTGKSPNDLQDFMQRLGVLMTSWQATTFLIGEYFVESDANPVFTVADGIIWVRQSVQRNSMVRKMEVAKMRGQATVPGLHSFRIDSSGLTVFAPPQIPAAAPEDTASEAVASGTIPASIRSRLKMGIPALDDMLCGGLPAGYSMLLAGPSGAGKSIVASRFLIEGVDTGEAGVLVAFEQRRHHFSQPEISKLIAHGKIALIDTQVPDLSIEEILFLTLQAIDRLGATRVVIDSLSGLELALAPTFRDDFKESLARLVTALSAKGVTVVMTGELEDRYTDLRFSPYGTAFLTDAIIVMRYVEIGSQLRRVLGVVKLRGSGHSNALREFSIDNDGLVIAAPIDAQEGLLSGAPRRKI